MAPKGIINKKPPLQYVYVSWDEVENIVWELADEMKRRKYVPDVICGIIRGGLIPATMLSHALGIRMITICVGKVGVNYYDFRGKILLAEDINDSGNTLGLIKRDLSDYDRDIKIRTATLFKKPGSKFKVDFCVRETSDYIVFPWELND